MYFSIDRIIGKTAVLIGQDAKPLEVPLSMLPEGAKAGEMVLYKNSGFVAAPEKTDERRARMAAMLEQLLKGNDE